LTFFVGVTSAHRFERLAGTDAATSQAPSARSKLAARRVINADGMGISSLSLARPCDTVAARSPAH